MKHNIFMLFSVISAFSVSGCATMIMDRNKSKFLASLVLA